MTGGEQLDLPVQGGTLRALRWGNGPRVVVALHGITANAMGWGAVARHIGSEVSLVALDLRGRGHSRDLPGPYGTDDLARDARDACVQLGAEVLAGHSLGGYIAAGVDHLFPGTVNRLVLVDGGLPLPPVPGIDPNTLLDAAIGPMIQRLQSTYPNADAYLEFFRAHPAMGPYWSEDLAAYARYDTMPTEPGAESVRPRALEEAVRTSGLELMVRAEDVRAAIRTLSVPTTVLTAPRGMFDQPGGFLSAEVVADSAKLTDRLEVIEIPDTNHYTVVLGDAAAKVVADQFSRT